MNLILDACTISNLIHAYQDDSLLRLLPQAFKNIFIAKEVVREVYDNQFEYLDLYESRESVKQFISDIKLERYISQVDKHKGECTSFVNSYCIRKRIPFRNTDGEYFSVLLSLYLSRWGAENFFEDNNKFLFATDDKGAYKMYKNLFSSNQVGQIIDSIDIVFILHIKGIVNKSFVIRYLEAMLSLYNRTLGSLKSEVQSAIAERKNETIVVMNLSKLMSFIAEGKIDELIETLSDYDFKKIFNRHKKIKLTIEVIEKMSTSKKIKYIKDRRSEVLNDMIWMG